MHLPDALTIPHWRAVLRHGLPNVVEGKLIPAAVLIGLLRISETNTALLGALAWAIAAVALRMLRGKRVSALLWFTTVALVVRTLAAVATGSTVVYFLQPTALTCLVGLSFLVSVPLGRPLAERLALDFWPMDDDTRSHPVLKRFFRDVSLWWAFTSTINFAITLWLLLSHSPTTFVLVKSFLGPTTTGITLTAAYFWFRTLVARTQTQLIVASPDTPLAAVLARG